MTEQHTPGSWTYHPDSGCVWTALIAKGSLVCEFIEPPSEADARLIVAAPDLLEALQSVYQWMDDQSDAQSKGGHATFDLMMLREQRDKARAAIARATSKEQT